MDTLTKNARNKTYSFVKIHFPASPREVEQRNWYLLIRNEAELMDFMGIDADRFVYAMLGMQQDTKLGQHSAGHRSQVLRSAMQSAVHAAPEGTVVWPHEVVSQFVHKKGMGMFKMLQKGNVLQVNQGGGWCVHDSFMKTWPDARVIDTMEKVGIQVPDDSAPIAADLLALENDSRVSNQFYFDSRKAAGIDNTKTFASICELKDRDPSWVARSIMASRAIAFETTGIDREQMDSMMELFMQLPGKEVYIRTTDMKAFTEHPMWEKNNIVHKIKFI